MHNTMTVVIADLSYLFLLLNLLKPLLPHQTSPLLNRHPLTDKRVIITNLEYV